jgi:hypothetical protein
MVGVVKQTPCSYGSGSSDNSVSDPNSIIDDGIPPVEPSAVAKEQVVINKEALEQTQTLSQRCSVEAIGEY